MATTLTTTWNPRGEDSRLFALLPTMSKIYTSIVVILHPGDQTAVQELLEKTGIITLTAPEWSWGRYLALKAALETEADVIHYADMDRLLRWVETRPGEWKQAANFIQSKDCVVFGRSESALQTHPQSIIQTERISNLLTSHFLGREMDVSAGSKSFSRQAAEFLVAHTKPIRAIGTDAEWLILLKRAGFVIDYITIDGLDYESADHYQDKSANDAQQRQHVAQIDGDPQQWAKRIGIAYEIFQSAIDAQ